MTEEKKETPVQAGEENALRLYNWLKHRGGIAVWESIDFSQPGVQVLVPYLTEKQEVGTKPSWRHADKPKRVVTSSDDVEIATYKEVRRFRVAVRVGGQGLFLKLTDASSKKVRQAEEKAGDGAFHQFDYDTQEAVIFVPEKVVTLTEWLKDHPPPTEPSENSVLDKA